MRAACTFAVIYAARVHPLRKESKKVFPVRPPPLAKERWYTGDYDQNGSESCVETKLILKEELP